MEQISREVKEFMRLLKNAGAEFADEKKAAAAIQPILHEIKNKLKDDILFEGAVIEGRAFPFIKVTLSGHAKIMRFFYHGGFLGQLRYSTHLLFFPSRSVIREWKMFRSIAFKKNFTWKIFRIIPKELRIKSFNLRDYKVIKKSFFEYSVERGIVFVEPSRSPATSEMMKPPESSKD